MSKKNNSIDKNTVGQNTSAEAYWLLGFLFLLNMINIIDRSLIASLANFIVPDLGLTNTQFGLLTGIIFLLLYSIIGLFMGVLADRVNRVRLISFAVILWSGLTAVSGFAQSFISLAIPRAFIGIGEAALGPAALSLLANKFPLEKLGFASSIFALGVPLGVGVSLLIAGYLGPEIGWRACFYILGGIGVVLALLLLLLFKDSRAATLRSSNSTQPASLLNIKKPLIEALSAAPVLGWVIAAAALINMSSGALSFDQLWLVQERGFDRGEIAKLSGVVTVFAGVAGCLVSAFGMDYCYRRYAMPRVKFMLLGMLVLAPVSYIYRLSDTGSLFFWFGFALAPMYIGFFIGPLLAIIQEHAPSNRRGVVVGFTFLINNLFGLALGNMATGIAIDSFAAQGVNQPYTTALVVITMVSQISLLLLYRASRLTQKPADTVRVAE